MIEQVRGDGRKHFNRMIAQAFAAEGPETAQAIADELDYFGMAGFDGAFIAWQADPARGLTDQLADALAAMGERVLAPRARPTGRSAATDPSTPGSHCDDVTDPAIRSRSR
ncbi:hypothetical protein ABZ413_07770 [Nocardia rhamnosiphila]|uniref:hypothetical protein n=1 Tax=Nocardia rhamnosiphila TaxID=426716 RepID=UPI00340307EC